jgi:hypothetical protein
VAAADSIVYPDRWQQASARTAVTRQRATNNNFLFDVRTPRCRFPGPKLWMSTPERRPYPTNKDQVPSDGLASLDLPLQGPR